MLQRLSSEFVGTFALVFAGCLAIGASVETGGVVTHLGIALTFGLVITAMIYAVGDVSGAHFNPAVSLGFLIAGRMKPADFGLYVVAPCAGAIVASLALVPLFPLLESLGVTLPAPIPVEGVAAVDLVVDGAAVTRAFVLEIILTFFLMFVILGITSGISERGNFGGLAIGGTITFCALAGGPISGASMNPARSLGPALVEGNLDHLWIYLIAPLIGAALAVGGLYMTRHLESRPRTRG